jgi:hypothetical protein
VQENDNPADRIYGWRDTSERREVWVLRKTDTGYLDVSTKGSKINIEKGSQGKMDKFLQFYMDGCSLINILKNGLK